jgi:Family of unknown function (DUF5825)
VDTVATVLTVTAWRERDDRAIAAVAGLALGTVTCPDHPVAAARLLLDGGARRVRLAEPVDARAQTAVPALLLVRELTRFGVAVDWDLTLDPAAHDWRELSNLYPPGRLHGNPDGATGLARWRDTFYPGRFIVRKGPGFLQVRDWRWSTVRLATIHVPVQVDLLLALLAGPVDAADPVAAPADDLEQMRLLQRTDGLLWTPAYRIWRWPMPAEYA